MLYPSLRGSAAALILCIALPALAQNAPAKPASKPTTPKAAAKPATKPARTATAARKTPPPPPEPVLNQADEAQLAAAERAHLGDYQCEFNERVHIERHGKEAGYIDVAWNKYRATMKPVLSSTGALRLEDVRGRLLMIQIANKSMLLDTKIGQRVLDDCVHPEQARQVAEARAAAASDPEAAKANSIGITPVQ